MASSNKKSKDNVSRTIKNESIGLNSPNADESSGSILIRHRHLSESMGEEGQEALQNHQRALAVISENDQLKAELSLAKDDRIRLARETEELKSEKNELKQEVRQLSDQLLELHRTSRCEIKELNDRLYKEMTARNEPEKANNLQAMDGQLARLNAELESKTKQVDKLRAHLNDANKKLEGQNKEAINLQAMDRQLARVTAELEIKSKQVDELRVHLNDANKKLEGQNKETFDDQLAAKDERIKALEHDNKKLQGEVQDLNYRIRVLRREKDRVLTSNEKLTAQLEQIALFRPQQLVDLQHIAELKKIEVPNGMYRIKCNKSNCYWNVGYPIGQRNRFFKDPVCYKNWPFFFKVTNRPKVDIQGVSLLCAETGKFVQQRTRFLRNAAKHTKLCCDGEEETEFEFFSPPIIPGNNGQNPIQEGVYKVIIRYVRQSFIQSDCFLTAAPSKASVFILEPSSTHLRSIKNALQAENYLIKKEGANTSFLLAGEDNFLTLKNPSGHQFRVVYNEGYYDGTFSLHLPDNKRFIGFNLMPELGKEPFLAALDAEMPKKPKRQFLSRKAYFWIDSTATTDDAVIVTLRCGSFYLTQGPKNLITKTEKENEALKFCFQKLR